MLVENTYLFGIYIYIYIYTKFDFFDKKQTNFFQNLNTALFGIGLWRKYLNLTKSFLLRLFEMVENQTDFFEFKQRYDMKSFHAENCKPCKNNLRIFDLDGEACFSQKTFKNWLNIGCARQARAKMTVHGVGKCWLSGHERNHNITLISLKKKVQL